MISKEKKKGAADSIHLSLTDIHQNGTNGELSDTSGGTTLSIYDLKNKYIAYSGVISASDDEKAELGGIVTIVSEWGQIYVVTKTRRVSWDPSKRIYEKTLCMN